MPTRISGTVLSATEFCDSYAHSTILPPSTPIATATNGTAFEVCHILICNKGVLVIARHNEVHDKLLYLAWQDFTLASVRARPLICQGCTISEREICQGSDKEQDTWGDVMIRGLWDQQSNSIIDVKLNNADADSYKHDPMAALLVLVGNNQ